MNGSIESDLKRRFFLMAPVGFFIPHWMWATNHDRPILCWKLEEQGDKARESVSGSEDPIPSRTGHACWVGTGSDRALRLDGYSVWIEHPGKGLSLNPGDLSISAWLALESYPVNEAAIVQIGNQPDGELRFAVDRWGYLESKVSQGGRSSVCKSKQAIPRAKWTHLALTSGASGMTLYQDGLQVGQLSEPGSAIQIASDANITLGKTPECSIVAGVFPTGVLNGLLRDVLVFESQLSPQSIADIALTSKPASPPNLQLNGPWCAEDPQRPTYHALPPRAWTNEPHGLIHWGGKYHIFYQKNPNGPYWGHINWGHMTSPDLYRWTEMPVALTPEPGPDSEGCWSGSVINHDGKLAIIYTGGNGARASICLAQSDDGIHFAKHPANPIIPQPPQGMGYPEFRDPFVWRERDIYYLIIGSAIKDVGGTALLYRSKDLLSWEYRKPLLVGDRNTSGVFWEMPSFVKLGDQHALLVCEVPGRESYWVGTWKDETFTPRSTCPQRLELFNHMLSPTPHALDDGRIITMGIIPDERSPKECWRAGWAHLYSLPRVVSADAHGRIHQTPHEGIHLWSEPQTSLSNLALTDAAMTPIANGSGRCLNIRTVFKRGDSRSVTLRVRSSQDGREQTDIHYEWEIGRLVLDRSCSSLDPQVKRDIQESTYFPDPDGILELNVFLDESVLEVFLDRRAAFAARIYPTLDHSDGVAVGSRGNGAIVERITIARMKKTA